MRHVKILGLLAVAAAAMMAFAASSSATSVTTTTGGGAATPTIHMVNEWGHVTLANAIANIECNSTAEGQVQSHGAGKPASGSISKLEFTGCTNSWHVTVSLAGSLSMEYSSGHNGTVTSNGASITTTRFGVTCNYETNNTKIGTLTGGSPATLDIEANIPIAVGSSFLCGNGDAKWAGSYTTTSALYVAAEGGCCGGGEEGHPLRSTPGALFFKAGFVESKEITLERAGATGVTTEGASFVDALGNPFSGIDFDGSLTCFTRSYGTSCSTKIKNTRTTSGKGYLKIKTSSGDKYIPITVDP